jgi:hypothetical protein
MRDYVPYVKQLQQLLSDSVMNKPDAYADAILAALDGEAGMELYKRVDLHSLRHSGAFFTGSRLSHRAAGVLASSLTDRSVVLDPACGAGDLLLAVVDCLPVKRSAVATLRDWGRRLLGKDIHGGFVRACKLRLGLKALQAGPPFTGIDSWILNMLPGISKGSGLRDGEIIRAASHIVVNPPFSAAQAPKGCNWASGRISLAAYFLMQIVTQAQAGTRVVAILPDVLRSGSRYGQWRHGITSRSIVQSIDTYGRFSSKADVDVFLLELLCRPLVRPDEDWSRTAQHNETAIGHTCEVHVGPVVDYRSLRSGPWTPFLVARGLPAWTIVSDIDTKRKYKGRLFLPPFVAVRRTSRPGDPFRAVATVIAGHRPVAVENHLLIISPKNKSLGTCLALMRSLRTRASSDWLDQRIRCRHLTVGSIQEMPFWKSAT